jgi:hypothetical protein
VLEIYVIFKKKGPINKSREERLQSEILNPLEPPFCHLPETPSHDSLQKVKDYIQSVRITKFARRTIARVSLFNIYPEYCHPIESRQLFPNFGSLLSRPNRSGYNRRRTPEFRSHIKGESAEFGQYFLDILFALPSGPGCHIGELVGYRYLA